MFHRQTATLKTIYCNIRHASSDSSFTDMLSVMLQKARKERRPVVFLCIGSDRATGDSLGPVTGQALINYLNKKREHKHSLFIYGSLTTPIHAVNLSSTIQTIYDTIPNPYVIAIDASLGSRDHISHVTLGQGSLSPGIGVHKQLPAVGDAFITGIVNSCDHGSRGIILQTTRLATVIELSNFITRGILYSLKQTGYL